MIKRILKAMLSRGSIVIILLALQVVYFAFAVWRLSVYFQYISWALTVLSIVLVLYIISLDDNPAFKLAWCIAILVFPLFGGLLYILCRTLTSSRIFKERLQSGAKLTPELSHSGSALCALSECDEEAKIQANYLTNQGFPIYNSSGVKYFSVGEDFFEELKDKLKTATRYIFMEYFIIAEGRMWQEILDILENKAKSGIDVRVMYDSMGSLFLLPDKYYKVLEEKGIKCTEFNPFRPTLSPIQNSRDHRKICVIDGIYAFTGGINIGDEYINHTSPRGHWKDNSVMITGDGAKSFTYMFLSLWNSVRKESDNSDYLSDNIGVAENDGFLIPYADTPWDDEYISSSVYLNLISRARKYLYITTPYFIVGDEFVTALILAAKSGVDVRIVVPAVWDKKFVYITTCSYFERLIKSGVRVYRYMPGFIHGKTFLCDDTLAAVGTANVDYRSMYLQYECGVWMCGCKCIKDIKADFEDIIEKSSEVTLSECSSYPYFMKLLQRLFQIFAPLM